MPTDPICGMEVDPKKASKQKLLFYKDDTTYYFCSQQCLDKFKGQKSWKSYISWILSAILVIVAIIVYRNDQMLPFMGTVFLLLSILKIIDIRGFAEMFKQYDSLAKSIPGYAVAYPFIELYFAISFLFEFQVKIAAAITVFVMVFGTYGVVKNVLSKDKLKCACLGSKIKVPLTEFTIAEDITMLVMGLMVLLGV